MAEAPTEVEALGELRRQIDTIEDAAGGAPEMTPE
jgi:hypothetical protein